MESAMTDPLNDKTSPSPALSGKDLLAQKKRALKQQRRAARDHFNDALTYHKFVQIATASRLSAEKISHHKRQFQEKCAIANRHDEQAHKIKQEIKAIKSAQRRAWVKKFRQKFGF